MSPKNYKLLIRWMEEGDSLLLLSWFDWFDRIFWKANYFRFYCCFFFGLMKCANWSGRLLKAVIVGEHDSQSCALDKLIFFQMRLSNSIQNIFFVLSMHSIKHTEWQTNLSARRHLSAAQYHNATCELHNCDAILMSPFLSTYIHFGW